MIEIWYFFDWDLLMLLYSVWRRAEEAVSLLNNLIGSFEKQKQKKNAEIKISYCVGN